MAYLIYHGVIQGDAQNGDLFLHPAARLTRAQAAVLIARAEAVELRPAAREPPTVTALGPIEGPRGGGGPVVIVGSGFQGATSVTFGRRVIHRAGFRVDSDTQITVKAVPGGSGTVHVSVTTPLGRSSVGPEDTYRYLVSLTAGDRTVRVALRYLGVPYVWAGNDADGFDCSGLVMDVFSQLGVNLPHNAALQYDHGVDVSREQLRPGDLVFFYQPIHHVAIYLGEGNMVTAPCPGAFVCIEPVLWSEFAGARRISG
jgi:cell wall-associated NlpC family hydrolase